MKGIIQTVISIIAAWLIIKAIGLIAGVVVVVGLLLFGGLVAWWEWRRLKKRS